MEYLILLDYLKKNHWKAAAFRVRDQHDHVTQARNLGDQ